MRVALTAAILLTAGAAMAQDSAIVAGGNGQEVRVGLSGTFKEFNLNTTRSAPVLLKPAGVVYDGVRGVVLTARDAVVATGEAAGRHPVLATVTAALAAWTLFSDPVDDINDWTGGKASSPPPPPKQSATFTVSEDGAAGEITGRGDLLVVHDQVGGDSTTTVKFTPSND